MEKTSQKINLALFFRHDTRKYVRDFVVHAHRENKRVWTGTNVNRYLSTWMNSLELGYSLETGNIRTIVRNLVDNGYAYVHLDAGGKRTKEFGFLPSVDLSGFINDDLKDRQNGLPSVTHTELPPIPGKENEFYRLDELVELLKTWAEQEEDLYKDWIDASISSLSHRIEEG